MGIIRKRATRIDPTLRGALAEESEPGASGWLWAIDVPNLGRRSIDYTRWRDRGRAQLGEQLRVAHRVLAAEERPMTTLARYQDVNAFYSFLEDIDPNRTINRLVHVDGRLCARYHLWLSYQFLPGEETGNIPLSQRTIQLRLSGLLKLLANRAEITPELVASDVLAGDLRGALVVDRSTPRPSYTKAETRRILAAMKQVLEADAAGAWKGPDSEVLSAALVILAYRSGANLSALLELTEGALHPHPADPHRIILVLHKARAGNKEIRQTHLRESTEPKQLQVLFTQASATSRVKNLITWLQSRAAPLRVEAAREIRESLWLYRSDSPSHRGTVMALNSGRIPGCLGSLVKRFGLNDDRGRPLRLRISRIRPTFIQTIYELSGYDFEVTQRLAGHSRSDTALKHYLTVTGRMEAQFGLLQRALMGWVRGDGVWATKELAGAFEVPLEQALRLLEGKNATHLASCTDPHNGKYAPKNGVPCTRYMYCFKCPNMVVLEDDLWRLFSFRNALVRDRDRGRLPLHEWVEQFEWMVKVIDHGIARLFNPTAVESAQCRAAQDPYPLWRDFPMRQAIEPVAASSHGK